MADAYESLSHNLCTDDPADCIARLAEQGWKLQFVESKYILRPRRFYAFSNWPLHSEETMTHNFEREAAV